MNKQELIGLHDEIKLHPYRLSSDKIYLKSYCNKLFRFS